MIVLADRTAGSGRTSVVKRLTQARAVRSCSSAALAVGLIPASAAHAQNVPTPAPATAPASAQDSTAASAPGADADTGSKDIIVTATRRSERVVDVPASISVVNTQTLTTGGNVSNLDLTSYVPGLKMERVGVNLLPAVRGITSLVSGPGFDPNVATYLDGVYASNNNVITDLPDVESVVVLKGPQGTLFGRNATGGAIQITTKKPSNEFYGDVSATYGSLNDIAIKGFVSVPLIDSKLSTSLAFYNETRDGYLYDVVNKKRVGDSKGSLLRAKILFTPTDNVSILATGFYSLHNDPAGSAGTALEGSSQANRQAGAITPSKPYEVAGNTDPFEEGRSWGGNISAKVETGIGTFTSIGSYLRATTEVHQSAYGGYAPAGGYLLNVYQQDRNYAGELNFASKTFGPFSFIAGYYYYNDDAFYTPLQINRDVTPLKLSVFGFQKALANSGYGEATVKFTDKLTLTAGIRYSSETRRLHGLLVSGAVLAPTRPLLDYGSTTFNAWTPRFSLRYEIADRTNVYFTYSQGFKSGGYDATGVLSGKPVPIGLTPVKPEHLYAYEAGIKSAPAGGAFDISVSGYYYDYKDQQVTSYVNVGGVVAGVTGNAAASEIYGADIEGGVRVTPELRLHTGISLIHARFTNYTAAVVNIFDPTGPFGLIAVNRDSTGNRLPRTPDWTVSVGGTYKREFKAGTLALAADLFISDKTYLDVGNVFSQPSYENLDASIAWTLPGHKLTFTAWGKNLTDAVRILGSNIGARSAFVNWAPPRTYGVTVSAKF